MDTIHIQLVFEGQNSSAALGIYVDSRMADDISQVGWNLVECKDDVFTEKIGDCSIATSSIGKKKGKIALTFPGSDKILMEQTIQEYLNGFEDYIRPTILELRSRTDEKYVFSLKEIDFFTAD